MSAAIFETRLDGLKLISRGKVRDIYDLGGDLLVVATDRLSAFDVVMNEPIPGKGTVLTKLTEFWMKKLVGLVPTHLTGKNPEDFVAEKDKGVVRGRSQVVRKAKPFAVECVVRGYVMGSGWKDYQKTGMISGIKLPAGLMQADKLAEPIFTPSTKAESGHDMPISFAQMSDLIGNSLAQKLRDFSLKIYKTAADFAKTRGILIADTKFEFGLVDDKITLIDEVLTPDSSRYWPESEYRVGISPPSFDKQFVRDYLESLAWNKMPPPPPLPQNIIDRTAAIYQEIAEKLMSV